MATAEELLDELLPIRGQIWRNQLGSPDSQANWIFRGHANSPGSPWKLTPTAMRPGWVGPGLSPSDFDGKTQRGYEVSAVMRFSSQADHSGYPLPNETALMRDTRVERHEPEFSRFPSTDYLSMFALAQHYGIPTRLLDWTWKPLVATYFAARAVANRRFNAIPPPGETYFSIFALEVSAIFAMNPLDPSVHLIMAPRSTNPNLHAQGGCFTLVQPQKEDLHPLPDIDDVLRDHHKKLDLTRRRVRTPALIEFRTPPSEARAVMMLLGRMGVNAASIFPGLAGVADTVREELRCYQYAKVGSRNQ